MHSNPSTFTNCAHRGASGHAPENTLAAMRLAMEMGAHMSELDVQQTADDRLVLLHDDDLDRTTSGRGPLWQKPLAELQSYEAGKWFAPQFAGEPLPTLEDVISLVRGKMKLNIEVKLHGHERDIAKLVVATIRSEKFENECLVTSFGHEVADEIKALAPELKVGYIFGKDEYHERVFEGPVEVLSVNHYLISAEFMKRARAANKEVHVWTVNEKPLMHRLMDLGVDAIITNYPDRLAEVARERIALEQAR
jgi:glycerophosphoryl diester phosphodiesterase